MSESKYVTHATDVADRAEDVRALDPDRPYQRTFRDYGIAVYE
jgi:hypothetical protein